MSDENVKAAQKDRLQGKVLLAMGRHGIEKTRLALGLSRNASMAIAVGRAREGSCALARENMAALDQLLADTQATK